MQEGHGLHRRRLSRVASPGDAYMPALHDTSCPACRINSRYLTLSSIPSGMGLTLTFDDFREVLATPGRIFAGFALQYTIMPLMAFAVSRLMGLPLAFTIG